MVLETPRASGPGIGRIVPLAAALMLLACGHRLPPPGGPEDETPPRVVSRFPAPDAVGVDRNIPIRVGFDEDMKFQRRTGSIRLLPVIEPLNLRYAWDSVEIRPEGSLPPDCTVCVHFVEIPTDLRGNRPTGPLDFCFSTGDSSRTGRMSGTVDAPEGKTGSVVLEAMHLPDSLRYRPDVDAGGAWSLGHLPRGRWRIRAFLDTRRDGRYDPPGDLGLEVARVLEGDSLRVDLEIPPSLEERP